jgi:hypothetical protein
LERLWPILVVHDLHLAAHGHPRFLAQEFSRLIAADEDFGTGFLRKGALIIALPVLLTVEDLEWMEATIKDVSLLEILKDYNEQSPDRGLSFTNYLSLTDKVEVKGSPTIAAAAVDLLTAAAKRVFPEEDFDDDSA